MVRVRGLARGGCEPGAAGQSFSSPFTRLARCPCLALSYCDSVDDGTAAPVFLCWSRR